MAHILGAGSSKAEREHRFFLRMAALILLFTVIGFAPSYYLRAFIPPLHPMEPLNLLVHLHGIVFSSWVILFMVQVGLISAGKRHVHRQLGMLGILLVALMIPLAIAVGIAGIHRPLTAAPGIDPLSWAALPLLDAPVFGGLIISALAMRHRPDVHKRLMLVAMINMVQPSAGRLIGMTGLPGEAVGPLSGLVVLALLAALLFRDWLATRRFHPAVLIGSAIVFARIALTPVVWSTGPWLSFARWVSGGG
ncbi:hypothetical protein [Blastomonas sp.]|uniref:hypothetical protein n=1 Tax=Blastomonas sp. TaxID=1909299 RepID=UPI00391BD9E3